MILMPYLLRPRSLFRVSLALGAALLIAGCQTQRVMVDGVEAQPFVPVNHAGVERLPEDVRRIVLLPASGGDETLDEVLVAALQRRNRFEVVRLTRTDLLRRFRRSDFSSTAALPPTFLATIGREYAADAVMFVDVTTQRSIRPLALGLRGKLATIGDDVRLLWTFDNVFSAAEPSVASAARRHYLRGEGANEMADRSAAVFQSPRRFAAYVADSTFATLPPR